MMQGGCPVRDTLKGAIRRLRAARRKYMLRVDPSIEQQDFTRSRANSLRASPERTTIRRANSTVSMRKCSPDRGIRRANSIRSARSQTGVDPILLSRLAEMVIQRIETKLTGTDFGRYKIALATRANDNKKS